MAGELGSQSDEIECTSSSSPLELLIAIADGEHRTSDEPTEPSGVERQASDAPGFNRAEQRLRLASTGCIASLDEQLGQRQLRQPGRGVQRGVGR